MVIGRERSSIQYQEGHHGEVVGPLPQNPLLHALHRHPSGPLAVQLVHGHLREVLPQLVLLLVEQLLEAVADHEGDLVPSQEPVVEGAYALQDGRQLLLRRLAEGDADDLDELLPADEVAEVADVLYELFTGVHVEAFEADFEGLAVHSLLDDLLEVRGVGVSEEGYFFEGLVEVVEVVDFEAIEAVLLYEVGDVLRAEQGVLFVELLQQIPLGHCSLHEVPLDLGLRGLLDQGLPAQLLHHDVQSLGDELVTVGCGGQCFHLFAGSGEQPLVDDFVGVVRLGLEERVLVVLGGTGRGVVILFEALVVPACELAFGGLLSRQSFSRVVRNLIDILFYAGNPLPVINFLPFLLFFNLLPNLAVIGPAPHPFCHLKDALNLLCLLYHSQHHCLAEVQLRQQVHQQHAGPAAHQILVVVYWRPIDIEIVELSFLFGEFPVLAFELLCEISEFVLVAALAAGAVFHKGVVQFVPQAVAFGREDGENAAVVELSVHQSPHQFFPEGCRGAVGDAELVWVGVEVDEGLAVSAVGFAGRAGCCGDCPALFLPAEALPDLERTGRSLSIMQIRQNALLLTVTEPGHQHRLLLLPAALGEPVPPHRSLLLGNPINKYKPILTSDLTVPLYTLHELLILLQVIQL